VSRENRNFYLYIYNNTQPTHTHAREMLDIPNFFFPKVGSQMMCHNPIRLWHISQNDKSHEIVTHH